MARVTVMVVAGVIHRDGKVLIGQRMARDRHGLKWEFPGGKVEPGETPRQALQRELREELGVESEVGAELARYEHTTGGRSLLLLFLGVNRIEGEPRSVAFEEIRWEEPTNLPAYDFLDGDLDFVRQMARGRIPLL
jgi:8-oxo-dGTP diphosphatase